MTWDPGTIATLPSSPECLQQVVCSGPQIPRSFASPCYAFQPGIMILTPFSLHKDTTVYLSPAVETSH